ncbi:MAG: hypothetical protein IH986_03185 [Planctomycetes bacterium]|nr:hypothetical protein [Planctomycetota bacterium]
MARPYRPNWERLRLDYFQRRSPYRVWKFALSFALPGLAGGWIALEASRGSQQIYTSGAMSKVHVQWTHQCSRCHEGSFTRLKFLNDGLKDRMAMNEACLHCHGATIGHDKDSIARHQGTGSDDARRDPPAACSNCHSEHQGNFDLKDVPDRRCTDCHQSLTSKEQAGELGFKLKFELGFASVAKHPEFQFLRIAEKDSARIKFNHKRHLDASTDLPSPDGPVKLKCSDCHRAGQAGAVWRFAGKRGVHEPKRLAATESEPELQQAYMDTIRYSLHCAKCHPLRLLDWTSELPGVKGSLEPGYVPHDTIAAIRNYLRGQFTVYVSDPGRAAPPAGRKPLTLKNITDPEKVKSHQLAWIFDEIKYVERALYLEPDVMCRKCHELNANDDVSPPSIAPPQIPMRWLFNASFDHARHKSIVVERIAGDNVPKLAAADFACLKCHGDKIASRDALSSVNTSDILLPGIAQCRECHGGSAGVSDTCTTCHTYHRAPRRQVPSTSLARKAGE